MDKSIISACIKKSYIYLIFLFLMSSSATQASFIESAMGTAVVNDATAVYYNPAALVLLPNAQIIVLNSLASFRTKFTGDVIPNIGLSQSGDSISKTHYHLPALYFATPLTPKISAGIAVISNLFNKDLDGRSILRYVQSNNNIKDIDIVPALQFKLNDRLSLGVGMNFSYANFLLKPIIGFPTLDIADIQSNNECDGTGIGGDLGVLMRLSKSTLLGFNYRSAITYRLKGKSVFEGNNPVVSDNYGFTIWTPARSVLSINQQFSASSGMVATVQRIQWSIFKEINIHGIAAQIGLEPVILDTKVPYHFHDTWLLTLGSYYRISPKWTIRVAGSYNESPGNSNFQIVNGDSLIVGATLAYQLSKNITVDAGYAHDFVQTAHIDVRANRGEINGSTKGSLDAFSIKLIFNLI